MIFDIGAGSFRRDSYLFNRANIPFLRDAFCLSQDTFVIFILRRAGKVPYSVGLMVYPYPMLSIPVGFNLR